MFISFVGSTSRAGICVAYLKLTTLGRRIVNRLQLKKACSNSIEILKELLLCFKLMLHDAIFSANCLATSKKEIYYKLHETCHML